MTRDRVMITGGAGFIGTNLADRYASGGSHVTIFDNLSRPGVERNAEWLHSKHGNLIHLEVADIRDPASVRAAVTSVNYVFHLAAQVAVTSSLTDPRYDFEVNVGGTLNVLEALRSMDTPASLVFTSTNKVYGDLSELNLQQKGTRYESMNPLFKLGVNEHAALDFHSPYGCSKGAADQYVLDYARYYGIPALVFRMSCIYGPHQMGTEDQGWVAHFLRQSLEGQPITICGDGFQVRDILFVEDLVDACLLAQNDIATLAGQAFNIGGGSAHTISLVELLSLIHRLDGRAPKTLVDDWRRGDQRYYVSDIRKFQSLTGWTPQVAVNEGVRRLHEWLTTEYAPEPGLGVRGEHALLAH